MNKKVSSQLPFSPFIDRPLNADQMNQLVNRKKETDRLRNIVEAATEGLLNNAAILGAEGSGKTTLMQYLHSFVRSCPGVAFIELPVLSDTDKEQLLLMLGRKVLDLIDVSITDKVRRSVSKGEGEEKTLEDIEGITKKLTVKKEKTSVPRFILKLAFAVLFGTAVLPSKITEKHPLDSNLLVPLLIDISPVLRRKYNAIIVAIDEAGRMASDTTVGTLEMISTLFQREPWMLALAGNPETIAGLTEKCPEIPNRIPPTNRITLSQFELTHTSQLLEQKIHVINPELALGKAITPDAVNLIHAYAEGNPRLTILIADAALQDAYIRCSKIVDVSNVNNGLKEFDYHRGRDLVNKMNVTQQKILEEIYKLHGGSSTGLASKLRYSREWISKLLNQMERLGYLEPKRENKEVKYYLNRSIETYYIRMLGKM